MHSLIYEYQALNSQKEILSEKLDNIEDQFIRDETPLYKQRMLGVYKRMAPLKAPMLEFILKGCDQILVRYGLDRSARCVQPRWSLVGRVRRL